MTGLEMMLLRQRVAAAGYEVDQFHYHSFIKTPAAAAEKLHEFLLKRDAQRVRFVAHSLGGIVLCHLFDRYPPPQAGRVVMLGTPINSSKIARAYEHVPVMNLILHQSCEEGLLGDHPGWSGVVEAGMIAGTKGVGIGTLLLSDLPEPHDGTVSVEETRCEDMTDQIDLAHSHMGMLLSTEVAEQVSHFIEHGCFDHPA